MYEYLHNYISLQVNQRLLANKENDVRHNDEYPLQLHEVILDLIIDKLVNKLFNKELYNKLFVLEDQPQKENENWYEVAIILLFLLFLLYLLNHSIF